MGQSSCSPVRSPYLAGDQLFLLRPEHHRAPAETVGPATNADSIVKSAEARSELMKHVRSYANATRGILPRSEPTDRATRKAT